MSVAYYMDEHRVGLKPILRRVWARREQRAPSVPRSKGLVLRDFHMALEAGDRGAAREALQYVKERSLLNALNRRFLRIQMLHHFREWEEMLALDLEDVFAVRFFGFAAAMGRTASDSSQRF